MEVIDVKDRIITENFEKRLPKRKVALIFGYCGLGYQGLQM
jgi:hypothetical protein